MARTRTRTKQKRQKATQQQKTVTIAVSRGAVLMGGGVLLALALTVAAGLLLGQRLARPAGQPQSVAQQQAVSPQNLPAQSSALQNDTGKPTYAGPPPMTIDASKAYTATIKTDKGDIVIRLRPDLAPQHVNNFVFLARQGFYDGLWFHRVIPGFIAQAGDPKGDTTGGPGYLLPHEITDTPHKAGTVAMARLSDPFNPERDSSGSQFYIVLENSQQASDLDGQYTIFGEVVQGLDVARRLTPREPSDEYRGDEIITIEITEK
ncbi:MAG: peptidylprolyl isomerase [Anaerolineae bacterium]